ncbi:MAG: hypothetical protein NTW19_15765 [Planctomycetota bacterium]|nr:hypothetical protein [Planctomycetota bacterium]
MATTPISTNGLSSGSNATNSNALGNLSSGDFLKVVLSELRNQDPFQPQDSSKMLEQLSSLRNIESQLTLQQQLQSLVTQNGVTQASALIGKTVTGLDDTNASISGIVTSVRVQDGKATLELDTGKLLGMDRVTQIASVAGTNTGNTTGTTTTTT